MTSRSCWFGMRRRGREKEEVALEWCECVCVRTSDSKWIAHLWMRGEALVCVRVMCGRCVIFALRY